MLTAIKEKRFCGDSKYLLDVVPEPRVSIWIDEHYTWDILIVIYDTNLTQQLIDVMTINSGVEFIRVFAGDPESDTKINSLIVSLRCKNRKASASKILKDALVEYYHMMDKYSFENSPHSVQSSLITDELDRMVFEFNKIVISAIVSIIDEDVLRDMKIDDFHKYWY